MAEPDNFDTRDRAHISIDVFRETAAYTFPSRNQERKPLRGDYTAHATQLLDQLAAALGTVPAAAADPRLPIQGLKSGTVVEVTTLPPAEDSRIKAVKVPAALEFPTQDVVILRSERNEDRTESALVFVPDDARAFLRNRIADYGRDPGNQRRPDAERFEVIEEVRAAEAVSLFTGEALLPGLSAELGDYVRRRRRCRRRHTCRCGLGGGHLPPTFPWHVLHLGSFRRLLCHIHVVGGCWWPYRRRQ